MMNLKALMNSKGWVEDKKNISIFKYSIFTSSLGYPIYKVLRAWLVT